MAYKIIVAPAANLDIIEGIDWYNKEQPGLGLMFYKQVHAIIKHIRKNPFSFAIRYQTSHTALVDKFPYMIHYFVDTQTKTIVITSVLHTSRNPKIWDDRPAKI
jgi:hypothetical protein